MKSLIFLIVLLVVSLVPSDVFGAVAVAHETFVVDKLNGATLEPNALTSSADGYIIAGRISSTQQAWASKIDNAGRAIWQYRTGVRDKLPIGQGAIFSGAAVMSDGSSFLCGRMPRPPMTYAGALLTHLDETGRLLNEQLVVPQQRTKHGVAAFSDCARWGDDVAIVGSLVQFYEIGTESRNVSRIDSYWLILLDRRGKAKWEKQFPTNFDAIDSVGSLFTTGDQTRLMFVGKRVISGTELFLLDKTGTVRAQKTLQGDYSIIKPVIADNTVELCGYPSISMSDEKGPLTRIVLDDKLEEKSMSSTQLHLALAPFVGFRTPNNSLVLFGSDTHPGFFAPDIVTKALYLDSNLETESSVELNRSPYVDGGVLKAVTATNHIGEFVSARSLMSNVNGQVKSIGAAVDFVSAP